MKTFIKHLMIAGVIALGSAAYAIPTLTIFDGTTTLTILDGGPGDSAAPAGAVTFVGSIGNWTITVDTGLTTPALGSATNPELDLSFSATSSVAGGTLSVKFSDNGYSAVGGVTSQIGGTVATGAGSSVSSIVAVNDVALINSGPFSSGAFSNTSFGSTSLSASDVLSLEVDVVNAAGATRTSSGDFYVSVPDGGTTAVLLGLGLVGMSVAAVRRKKA